MERIETDAVLWMLDSEKNKSNINSIMIANEYLTLDRVQNIVQKKFLDARYDKNGGKKYPHAQKYIKCGLFNYYWVEDENFNLNNHVSFWKNKMYASIHEMKSELNDIITRPLIGTRPPWEYVLFHFMDSDIKKTCVLIRFHHVMADGLSLVNFMVNKLSDNVCEQLNVRSVPKKLQMFMKAKGLFNSPFVILQGLVSSFPDHCLYSTRVSGMKKVNWSEAINLNVIKEIKNKLKLTVNDVLMGCFTKCYRDYLEKRNGGLVPDYLKAYCPFNTRFSLSEAETLSNKFGTIHLTLPIANVNPAQNIMEINKIMNKLKFSGKYHGMRYVTNIMNYALPLTASRIVFDYLSKYASFVISNVPGPQQPIKIDGCEIDMMCFWPPQWSDIGMAVSISSYNGEVRIGLCCDEALQVDASLLLDGLGKTVESLRKSVSMYC